MPKQALSKAPDYINDSQARRGDFAALVIGEAIRSKQIEPPADVVDYFAAHPGMHSPSCVFCACSVLEHCGFHRIFTLRTAFESQAQRGHRRCEETKGWYVVQCRDVQMLIFVSCADPKQPTRFKFENQATWQLLEQFAAQVCSSCLFSALC